MSTLKDVTPHFETDKIHDVALVQSWVAAAAGDNGIVLVKPQSGERMRIATNVPMNGPILVASNKVFIDHAVGEYTDCATDLSFKGFKGAQEFGLEDIPVPHYSFATNQCLYGIKEGGDLLRLKIDEGVCEVPDSPYGRYEKTDHRVTGIAPSRQGVIVLSRYAGRSESLLDSLPDDPTRPKARAAVLKDDDWGASLIGPAVSGRWAHVVCSEKRCLLSQHLRNPEKQKEAPLPEDFGNPELALLVADMDERIMAATKSGLELLAGPGAPMHFSYPEEGHFVPTRLLAMEKRALIHTREGRLFMAEF